MDSTRTGGCLCGQIRYLVTGSPRDPHSCSCEQCRRHSGAPTQVWIELDKAQLRWTGPGGEPALWRSSATTCRAFCPHCGSTLGAVDDGPTLALAVGSLDRLDDDVVPLFHSFADQRPGWWNP
ncbi:MULTISPECIES: GFA family protein [Pseudomonas]|uniref:Ribulose phosphate epimerase n=2 Tax=Pseudomonas TaxID=286 RepID=A0A178LMS0_9PSED|nr:MULTISPECIES: GFA family protein [Pseudomonas]KXJ30300.1 ribulose phosphate epimerase [Pseudomonas sp. HUK17]MXS18966.1 GFA family protein [Pseudomonas oryzihabitans]NRH40313.1 GFA family protein [Pseudomonas sp. MS15a(2019)]OAN32313.1 ribulose phosphate epimerase [Pseudomonas oryzihabitans]UUW73792.1 GFA family protein [Pseudomonas psychrotolerans]